MSSSRATQNRRGAGALVPVSGFVDVCGPHSAAPSAGGLLEVRGDNARLIPARSAFLVQLTRQYENKNEAGVRRAETRQAASQCYGEAPEKNRLRHLVWA